MKKETLVQIIIIVVLSIVLCLLLFGVFDNKNDKIFNHMEEETEKETKKEDVDKGSNINIKTINLADYDTNINITEAGEYTITGSFEHSVLVDSEERVIINLDNVNIDSKVNAAIANINTGELVINIVKGTTNTLKDGGSSELDGCIYSSGKLIIQGSGKLNIYGTQQEGEGIATTDNDITINGGEIYVESADDGLNAGGDNGGVITINGGNITIKASGDGIDSNKDLIISGGKVYTMGSSIGGDAGIDTNGKFELNGGEIIALGSDMLQNPDKASSQKYVSFTLNSKINKSSKISLKDKNNKEIVSFTADEDFKTLIISNSDLTTGTYYIYVNGEKTEYSKTIN